MKSFFQKKVGHGIRFLPRKLTDLVKSLQIWIEEFTAETILRSKQCWCCNRRTFEDQWISPEKYTIVKEENKQNCIYYLTETYHENILVFLSLTQVESSC